MIETTRVITPKQVQDIGACQRLKPKESDFVGKPGYKRTYRKDGSYTWRYRFRPNDGGKDTREGAEVKEMMTPFIKADSSRHAALRERAPRVALKDGDGRVQYVEPERADEAASRNGWGHHWSKKAKTVIEFGPGGMLWRFFRGAWEPLSVRSLGAPVSGQARVPCRGIQRDPDGHPWRGLGRKGWVRL